MSPWLPMENEDCGWDLHAVVRSCRSASRPANLPATSAPLPPSPKQNPLLLTVTDALLPSCSTDLIDTGNALLELEELCRPFISITHQPKSLLSPRSPSPAYTTAKEAPAAPPPELRSQARLASQMTRSKKRKNQQKRVVCNVPADGLFGDMWAWRKYGQKPIKGSPYPRGYYRCSSSKGCLARKQVERSRTDPGMFVITYTAEHNHPLPTHRNSLAGSTRQKFSASSDGGDHPETSTSAVSGLSPNTPLTASMEDELMRRRLRPEKRDEGSTEEDEEAEEEEEEEQEEEGMLLVEDMEMVGDDDDFLFMGVEELQGSSSSDAAPTAFYGGRDGRTGVGESGDGFFRRLWSSSNSNAAAASGGG